jgi:hypothetical protein
MLITISTTTTRVILSCRGVGQQQRFSSVYTAHYDKCTLSCLCVALYTHVFGTSSSRSRSSGSNQYGSMWVQTSIISSCSSNNVCIRLSHVNEHATSSTQQEQQQHVCLQCACPVVASTRKRFTFINLQHWYALHCSASQQHLRSAHCTI